MKQRIFVGHLERVGPIIYKKRAFPYQLSVLNEESLIEDLNDIRILEKNGSQTEFFCAQAGIFGEAEIELVVVEQF
ncbi:MAG: hypothetical protein PUP92_33005 [Rhizonema sp. PD38]|nr:hypothetical protein [Rhizonema sp. PD38]